MTIKIPDVPPESITKDAETCAYFLEDNLAQWGSDGPVAQVWQWALTGTGPRPICGQPWHGGLPSRGEIEGESWLDDGWGYLATSDEVRVARFTLWWLTSAPEADVPERFLKTSA